MSYKDDITIAKHELDKEWINQPKLFCQYAEEAVEASFERDKAKEQLDLVKAEMDGQIRKNPTKFGLDKATDTAVANAIIQTEEYKKANSYFLDCLKKMRIMEVARESFDHKKRALEKLTDLFISGYWSEPKINKDTKDIFSDIETDKHKEILNKNDRMLGRKNK